MVTVAAAAALSVYGCCYLIVTKRRRRRSQKQQQKRREEEDEAKKKKKKEANDRRQLLRERLFSLLKKPQQQHSYNNNTPTTTTTSMVEFARDPEPRGYCGVPRRTKYRVLVTHLPSGTSWQELKRNMHIGGGVCYAEVSHDASGLTTGIVHYQSSQDAMRAIRQYDDNQFGRTPAVLRVKMDNSSSSPSCP